MGRREYIGVIIKYYLRILKIETFETARINAQLKKLKLLKEHGF